MSTKSCIWECDIGDRDLPGEMRRVLHMSSMGPMFHQQQAEDEDVVRFDLEVTHVPEGVGQRASFCLTIDQFEAMIDAFRKHPHLFRRDALPSCSDL